MCSAGWSDRCGALTVLSLLAHLAHARVTGHCGAVLNAQAERQCRYGLERGQQENQGHEQTHGRKVIVWIAEYGRYGNVNTTSAWPSGAP